MQTNQVICIVCQQMWLPTQARNQLRTSVAAKSFLRVA